MTKIVEVTSNQVYAAKLIIKRSAISGKPVSPAVIAIANARRAPRRSKATEPTATEPTTPS
jgi:hypothetical protein